MNDGLIALVCGLEDIASAVARQLLVSGCAVVLHQPRPPAGLHRLMTFADAWFDGRTVLEGVEARRVSTANQLLSGLRSRMFIPLLTGTFAEVAGRWPWDLLVDARLEERPAEERLRDYAELSIGLGEGFVAGETVDLVVDIHGRDPGAILRQGHVTADGAMAQAGRAAEGVTTVRAPRPGLFHGSAILGQRVEKGELLGWIADTPLLVPDDSPAGGMLRGLLRDGCVVAADKPVAEIVPRGVPVGGIDVRSRQIARAVVLAVEMEIAGSEPLSLPGGKSY